MSSVLPRRSVLASLPAHWRLALPLIALLWLALLLLYRDTGLAMVAIWNRSETFAHAFVVPPIALWLIWRHRAQLAAVVPRPSLLFALPLQLAAAAWLLGALGGVNALMQAALVALLVFSVPLLLGWPLARELAFPLGFLFFAVPVGDFMLPSLMEGTADFTISALRLTGIPVYREGLEFVIPSGKWSVVEACSGLRYLIASVMVGTLFAYLNYRSTRKRLIFAAVSILLPLLANWVRAYMIVMLGHLSGNKLAVGVDHLIYGWVFFGIVMLAMFMIGARWADLETEPAAEPRPAIPRPGVSVRRLLPAALLTLVLATLPQLMLSRMEQQLGSAPVRLSPPTLPGFAPLPVATDWRPHFEGAAAELTTAYAGLQAQPVGLYLGFYRQQGEGRKLVSSQNQLVLSDNYLWRNLVSGWVPTELGGRAVRLRSTQLRGPGEQLLVWQFYWLGGRLSADDVRAKALGAWQRLQGEGDDGAVVIVHTPMDAGKEAAERVLQDFLQRNWAAIEGELQAARNTER